MKSELEASGEAIEHALNANNNTAWAKADAEKASAYIKKMLDNGEVDAGTAFNAVARVTGNHSAMKQDLTRMGFLTAEEKQSALKVAIQAAQAKREAVRAAEMDAMLHKPDAAKPQEPAKPAAKKP